MKALPILTATALLAAIPGARAADMSLLGKWEIVDAKAAPWVSEERRVAAEAAGKRLLNLELNFAPKEVTSKNRTLGCKRAVYEPTTYPVDALFQGNLPEPNQVAVAKNMGFPTGDVPGVDVRCRTGVFSYHFLDRNTAMFGFNNVIYTIKRR